MSWRIIGELSLNLSTLIYFFWFVPQLVLTFRRRTIAAISLNMHICLVLGYLADFVYGFGSGLPFQYKLVSVSGLIMLGIQHAQFWAFNVWSCKQRIWFQALTGCLILLSATGFYFSIFSQLTQPIYNLIGGLSLLCWMIFAWPQLLKNFSNHSIAGISKSTVALSLTSGLGDVVTAFALAWAWPSKIGSLLSLLPKMLLWLQCYYYRRREVLNVV